MHENNEEIHDHNEKKHEHQEEMPEDKGISQPFEDKGHEMKEHLLEEKKNQNF